MLDHYLQRNIVYQLAFTPAARFSDIKPDDIENKLFTYHLKKVMSAGYVEKTADGLYQLTAEGRRLGFQAVRSERFMLDKAYSVLFLVVRRANGDWLLFTRGVHPLIGYTTFPVATPSADVTAAQAAARDLKTKTGLDGSFQPLGGGYYHTYKGSELESYTNFTLLVCEDASGELTPHDPNGTYQWVQQPDLTEHNLLPNMPELIVLYQAGKPFFIEETLVL